MEIIDAHQHFWKFDPVRDTWMTPGIMDKIRTDFLPEDLYPLIERMKVKGTIAVQADQSDAETRFLLELANQHDWILGVVGWVDLRSSNIKEKLAAYSKEKKLVGFRHILQAEPVSFMADPDFIFGLDQLAGFGYTYDLLIYWHQMEAAIELVRQLPDLSIVLDHIGKPDIRDGRILRWSKGLATLAESPNVFCKISGLVTEAHWQYWQPQDLFPYLDLTFQLFGPERCMFGSDWPVSTLATTYEDWLDLALHYFKKFSLPEQTAILSDNCKRFYGIGK